MICPKCGEKLSEYICDVCGFNIMQDEVRHLGTDIGTYIQTLEEFIENIESKKQADSNNPVKEYLRKKEEAQNFYDLAEHYSKGKGVKKNFEKALEYYKRSAELGNSDAKWAVGKCYFLGIGIKRNENEAQKWHEGVRLLEYYDFRSHPFKNMTKVLGLKNILWNSLKWICVFFIFLHFLSHGVLVNSLIGMPHNIRSISLGIYMVMFAIEALIPSPSDERIGSTLYGLTSIGLLGIGVLGIISVLWHLFSLIFMSEYIIRYSEKLIYLIADATFIFFNLVSVLGLCVTKDDIINGDYEDYARAKAYRIFFFCLVLLFVGLFGLAIYSH